MTGDSAAENRQVDPAERRIGRVLGDKWHLDRLLGVGGMAAVYAATHRNGARAAIKLFPFSVTTSAVIAERFLREGYLANKIGHPAVVRVLDDHIDHHNEHAYLVMELLHGQTARQSVERHGTMTPLEAIELMLDLSDCLEMAHARGVVHRDIKPENLFITEEGHLKVLDFGVAGALGGAHATLTRSGATLGTPAYMSPEQARGRPSDISPRSDIYSAGATLLFLLTGQILHQGENAQEILVKAAWTPAPKARQICPELPEDIANVIDRACAFEQADRYPDAAAFRRDLEPLRDALRASKDAISRPRVIASPMQTTAFDLSTPRNRDVATPRGEVTPLDPFPSMPSELTITLPPSPTVRKVFWAASITVAVVAASIGITAGWPSSAPQVTDTASKGPDRASRKSATEIPKTALPEAAKPLAPSGATALETPQKDPITTLTAPSSSGSSSAGSAETKRRTQKPPKSRTAAGTSRQSAPETAKTAERPAPQPAATPTGRDVGY